MSEATVVWNGWPTAPAPIAAVRAARQRGGSVTVVDPAGRQLPFGPGRQCIEIGRGLWLRTLDLCLRALATIVTSRRSPPRRELHHADGPTVLVLPVLPDLSHTFVYREVLALLRQRPDWQVLVLAPNPTAPLHAEAAELQQRVTWLPRRGVTARALGVLRWLLRRRGRELFGLYRAQPDGTTGDLLGKNPLRDPTHPGNAFEAADLLAASRPRHLHVYSSTYAANVVMGASHLLGVPFSISSYVDFEFPYAHKALAEKVARARFFRVVTAFCAASLRQRAEFADLPADRLPVVYLGLDLDNWRQSCAPSGQGVLVSAARLVAKKGLHLVPAALALLRRQQIRCRWRVLGDGPEREHIERACAEHDVTDLVEFLGPCDNAAVRAELLAADVALLPCVVAADGERDGIPVFLIEAMALGVPIVSTPISGIPELVRDGDTGFLCASGDSAALATTLANVLNDPAAAAEVGRRGREEAHATLDVNRKATELIARIESDADEV